MENLLLLIGTIGGLIGAVAGLSAWSRVRAQNKKDCADATESYAAAARSLYEPLAKRVDDLENELKAWKNWAERLVRQVRRLGHEPEPFIEPNAISSAKPLHGSGKW